MIVGDRIRLYPTPEQEALFFKFADIARFTYNECLAYKINIYQESRYSCRIQDLIEHIQNLKYSDEYLWLQDAPEAVTKQAIKDLDKAYKSFFKRGNKGFPKFKSKKKATPSFYQRTDRLHMLDDTHVVITGIKQSVRVKSSLLTDCPKNPRVTFDGKYWFLSYSFEVETVKLKTEGDIIGIDLGVKSLAVTSDGVVYKNINKSKRVLQLEKRKRHIQRSISRKYEMNKQGNKYVKTNNILKLENELRLVNRKLRNIRDTYLHTVTYELATRAKLICIEDLNVSGMLKNRHLSKVIQEQEFYKFRQYLTYKCKAYGTQLVIADKFYPSTKLMNCCNNKLKYVSLSQRTLVCPCCGKVVDRDLNAALNLRDYALAHC